MPVGCVPPVVNTLSGKRISALFPGERQAAGVSFRFSKAGARDFKPAGKLLQVYSAGRDGLAARGTLHVGTPRGGPAGVGGGEAAAGQYPAEFGKGQRIGHRSGNPSGVSSGSLR